MLRSCNIPVKEIHRIHGSINPYSVVAVRKRKRESSERVLWWTKLVLVIVVSMLLRESLSVYVQTNTANRSTNFCLEQVPYWSRLRLYKRTQTWFVIQRGSSFGVHPIRARLFLTSCIDYNSCWIILVRPLFHWDLEWGFERVDRLDSCVCSFLMVGRCGCRVC